MEDIKDLFEKKDLSGIRRGLMTMRPADIAQILGELEDDEKMLIAFRILPKELAAETFVIMDDDEQELLIKAFSDNELKAVIDELYLDDMVDIIEEMPATVVKRILRSITLQTRKQINELLQYPEDSAGSIMTIEYVDLKKDSTVASAFEKIRKTGVDKETIYTCYVTDRNRHLLGVVSAKTLLLSKQDEIIENIMETNTVYVETVADKEEAAKMFDKYDLLALPVVDAEKRLVGIVTVDDAIDVIREETSEDFAKMAAISPIEDSYFKTSVFSHAKNRILWLLILMLSATFTGMIITHYQVAFSTYPLLVSFIPMLMDTGGNCGAQSSTMIIRGLAVDEIELKDFFKALFKEMRIGLVVSIILAIVNAVRIYVMYEHNLELALVTGLTLIGAIFLAKSLGCCLPMLAKKLKLDPALMASPLITTIVDACSVLLYFNIAIKILNL